MADKNLDLAAKLERDIDNLLEFDKDETKFNPEKLKAMQIEINIPTATQKALKDIISKGVVDFNKFEAEDIDYKEVKPNEEDS